LIALEAPVTTLVASASLSANGGGGSCGAVLILGPNFTIAGIRSPLTTLDEPPYD
jgi:hypothetical protein